jgi:phage tail-like protein
MAQLRDRPYGTANFLVDFGDGKAESAAGGFSEVIFPVFSIAAYVPTETTAQTASKPDTAEPSPANRLILKRGFIGSLDLYAWWHKARQGRAPKRKTLQVRLLSEDHESVVTTWRFREVRPVSLTYSPLQANVGGILIETVEFAFESMEML